MGSHYGAPGENNQTPVPNPYLPTNVSNDCSNEDQHGNQGTTLNESDGTDLAIQLIDALANLA